MFFHKHFIKNSMKKNDLQKVSEFLFYENACFSGVTDVLTELKTLAGIKTESVRDLNTS